MAINKKYSYNGYDMEGKKAARQSLDDFIILKKQEIKDSPEYRTALILRQIKNAENAYNELWKQPEGFKRKQFLSVDPIEFSDCEIVNTNFAQHEPYTDVFPQGIKGCVFKGCILDNCNIPGGCTLDDGSLNRHYKMQNDGEYWFVDENRLPVSPKSYAKFDSLGLSKDPADIPSEPLAEPITVSSDPKVIERREFETFKNDETRLKAALIAEKASAEAVK